MEDEVPAVPLDVADAPPRRQGVERQAQRLGAADAASVAELPRGEGQPSLGLPPQPGVAAVEEEREGFVGGYWSVHPPSVAFETPYVKRSNP